MSVKPERERVENEQKQRNETTKWNKISMSDIKNAEREHGNNGLNYTFSS